jgi:hypothetical protein
VAQRCKKKSLDRSDVSVNAALSVVSHLFYHFVHAHPGQYSDHEPVLEPAALCFCAPCLASQLPFVNRFQVVGLISRYDVYHISLSHAWSGSHRVPYGVGCASHRG